MAAVKATKFPKWITPRGANFYCNDTHITKIVDFSPNLSYGISSYQKMTATDPMLLYLAYLWFDNDDYHRMIREQENESYKKTQTTEVLSDYEGILVSHLKTMDPDLLKLDLVPDLVNFKLITLKTDAQSISYITPIKNEMSLEYYRSSQWWRFSSQQLQFARIFFKKGTIWELKHIDGEV